MIISVTFDVFTVEVVFLYALNSNQIEINNGILQEEDEALWKIFWFNDFTGHLRMIPAVRSVSVNAQMAVVMSATNVQNVLN